jgi:hypothetical protein
LPAERGRPQAASRPVKTPCEVRSRAAQLNEVGAPAKTVIQNNEAFGADPDVNKGGTAKTTFAPYDERRLYFFLAD